MPRLTPDILVDLAKALSSAYLSVTQVDEFLFTKLERRFKQFASAEIPLDDAIFQIVQKAYEQGWINELARRAAEHRPNNQRLRTVCESLPTLDPYTAPSLGKSQIDRPSLLCGRAAQWNEVCQFAPTRLHQVLLVPGGLGQEPMHFRERVQVWLTPDPSRIMTAVHWPTPPKSLQEMIEALAVAFGCGVDGLQPKLRDKLAYQNVVLLHPCIIEGFGQRHYVDYYTQWLPSVLTQPTGGRLKCVQPIEWPVNEDTGGFLRRLLSRGTRSDERGNALTLVESLQKNQTDRMRILDVDELSNLQPREVEQFLEGSEFTVEHQKILLKRLLGGPQIPGFMFKTIDDYWKNISGAQ